MIMLGKCVKNIMKKIPWQIYILVTLTVGICFLWKDVQTVKYNYNKYYLNNDIGYSIVYSIEDIIPYDDGNDKKILQNNSLDNIYIKDVAIGNTPFETKKVKHYVIDYAVGAYYSIEGIKFQVLCDLPLLKPSMKDDVKNVVLLCDMMQRSIINHSSNNPTKDEDLKNMTLLMKELLFILYDKGEDYIPDITKLGDESRSTRSKYQNYSKEDYLYTLNDLESVFKRFNTFLEGEGSELFQDLLDKYSPKS